MDNSIKVRDQRTCNWFWIDKELWKNSDITASAKIVYATLAFYANSDNQSCFPSLNTLSETTGLTRPTIISALKKLQEEKHISIKKEFGKANQYILIDLTSIPVKNSYQSKIDTGTSKNKTLVVVKNKPTNNNNINNNNLTISKDSVNTPSLQERSYKKEKTSNTDKLSYTSTYLLELPNEDIITLIGRYHLTEGQIKLEGERAYNWMKSKGRTVKDYKHYFRNWILKVVEFKAEKAEKPMMGAGYLSIDQWKEQHGEN